MSLWHYELATPLGPMWAALDERGRLRQLAFGALDPRATAPLAPRAQREAFRYLLKQLDAYHAGKLQTFTVPLAPMGTEFQLRVWEEVASIPYGTVRTYGAIARNLGDPNAVRAVGQAVGANPIAILIPCHRVVGADGSLTGYAGGLDHKRELLRIEGAWPLPEPLEP